VIKFSNDYEEWFNIQMDKIGHELNRIETEQAGPEPICEAKEFTDNPYGLEQ
jgi:hypothetical protein